MAVDKGMGSCLIPRENGYPCGGQIQEGEPIGTVMGQMAPPPAAAVPLVGHRRCADAFMSREREKANMVKKYNQAGPGGAMDTAHPEDLVIGSLPLEKTERPPADRLERTQMPPGVRPLSELPFEGPQDVAQPLLTDDDRAKLDAYRQTLEQEAQMRLVQENPITHTVTLDLSEVPPEASLLQININLGSLRNE
jgi:hypothetical protein